MNLVCEVTDPVGELVGVCDWRARVRVAAVGMPAWYKVQNEALGQHPMHLQSSTRTSRRKKGNLFE